MEIFKAANSAIEKSVSISQSQAQTHTRGVEYTNMQHDVANKSSNSVEQAGLSQSDITQKTKEVTDKLNFQMDQLDTNVRFSYNDKINAMVVQVTEKDTGKVIRQLPSEQAIKISEYFKESIGLLFDKES